MTHQFKFGDRVRYLVSGTVGVITDIDPYDFAEVIHEDGSGDVYHFQDLELIPHPDTERLDWLAKNDCALTEMLCDDDGERLDTPFAVIQKQEEHFKVLAAANNIRQAIDAAMQEQAEEAKE